MTTTADEDDNRDKNSRAKTKSIKILIIVIILSIAIAMTVLFFGLQLLFGLGNPFLKVVSDSMTPTLQVNDTIIVKGGDVISFSDLKVGDIIVFYSPYNSNKVIVHRIINSFKIANTATNKENETIILTQGDANPFPIFGIDYPIREHNYIGKVVYYISNTDLLFDMLRPPVIQIIILALISVIVGSILYEVFNRILQKRRRKGEIKQS